MLNDKHRRRMSSQRRGQDHYMRYDDVFMSQNQKDKRMNRFDDVDTDTEYDEYNEEDGNIDENEDVFAKDDILNSRMVQYQRRKLPALQQYDARQQRRRQQQYDEDLYWREEDDYYARKKKGIYEKDSFIKAIWHRFFVAFAVIISLVCLSWTVYNWSKQQGSGYENNVGVVIEPQNRNFRVVPENPGGVEIPNQNRHIYLAENGMKNVEQNDVVIPQTTYNRPTEAADNALQATDEVKITAFVHYIKLDTSDNKDVLTTKIESIKTRFANLIGSASVSVQAISGKDGKKVYAVLVGPYANKQDAISIAKSMQVDCSVISTEKK